MYQINGKRNFYAPNIIKIELEKKSNIYLNKKRFWDIKMKFSK